MLPPTTGPFFQYINNKRKIIYLNLFVKCCYQPNSKGIHNIQKLFQSKMNCNIRTVCTYNKNLTEKISND